MLDLETNKLRSYHGNIFSCAISDDPILGTSETDNCQSWAQP